MTEAINGDCVAAMRQMPDNAFDLAIVDPVYGDVTQGGYMTHNKGQRVGTGKANQKGYHAGLWNQGKTGGDYFAELFRVSRNQIIWGGNYFTDNLPESQCWIVWDKMHLAERTFADCELAWTSFNRAARVFRFCWDGMIQQDMKNKEERIHPTQKPVALYKWLLNGFAEPGMKILDTHLGSGSSRIAAYDLGFDFVGYEIDQTYFAKQEERFKNHTNQMNLFTDFGL